MEIIHSGEKIESKTERKQGNLTMTFHQEQLKVNEK